MQPLVFHFQIGHELLLTIIQYIILLYYSKIDFDFFLNFAPLRDPYIKVTKKITQNKTQFKEMKLYNRKYRDPFSIL